jgi:hypothetical protein
MLLEEIKEIKSGKRDLRNFGLVMGVALGVLGGLLLWRGKDTYTYFFIVSAVFILLGLIIPSVLKPLQKIWMVFAVILGWFMTRLILSILFYAVFTSIRLISGLMGKKFLGSENISRESYWIKRDSTPFDKKNYERQF